MTSTGAAALPLAAISDLRNALGREHVCTDTTELDRYSRCTIPWQSRCGAVIFPGNTQEVAATLKIGNAHGLEIWPFSGGRNWGYGTTMALRDGAVVMLLSRMNRILEVNEELAYAVVEPGVSYRQLSEHLRSRNSSLWPDCIDGTPDGSVIGNALDRGIGETPYGDHFGNLCGLEVVLPTGDVMLTGGGGEALRTRHLHKWGVGPYVEGLFSQSNLGVVTGAGIWLMPAPEAFSSFVFELHDERHFPEVVDAFRRLALRGVLTSKLHMINDFVSLTVLTQRKLEAVAQDSPLTDADRERLRRKYRIAPWSCAGGLYGSKRHVALQRATLKRELGSWGRLLFVSDRKVAVVERLVASAWKRPVVRTLVEAAFGASLPVIESLPHVHGILKGIPTDYFLKHAYYRSRRSRPAEDVDPARDRCGLIWFAPVLPCLGSEVSGFLATCRARFSEFQSDFYVAMLMMNPRAVVCLMSIMYDRDDPAETTRATALYSALLDGMQSAGYEQYRAGVGAWDGLRASRSGGTRLVTRIKTTVDPTGMLAPGRYGVG
jgi:4-cresol dehydrogenase (hydroxylating) flavoprotein subunit